MGFDRARLVQVWTPPAAQALFADSGGVSGGDMRCGAADAGDGTTGSGYRVSDDLVLTAAHVVAGLPVQDPAEPRPSASAGAVVAGQGLTELTALGAATWVPAAVVWRDDDADVALLRAGPGLPDLPLSSPKPRWGRIDGEQPVEVTAVGFPWATARPDGVRDTDQAQGILQVEVPMRS